MKVFEIRDSSWQEEDGSDKVLGILFYYERARRFFVELFDGLSEWEAPAVFYAAVKDGVYSMGSKLSMKWVSQRVVPLERQNIGQILKDNGLHNYDEYRLLVLGEGRCAQDDEYIVKTVPESLPTWVTDRLKRKVRDVMILSGKRAVVFFRDDTAGVAELKALLSDRIFAHILSDDKLLAAVSVVPGGNGIEWDDERCISAETLYSACERIDIGYDDLLGFVKTRLADTGALAEMMDVSRQYINQLVEKGRLSPVVSGTNAQVFARADIEGT